ncbi:inositol polyphosphate 5-phosphatase K-like [Gigantopelta aegis]|uniref:inositol polyphosphate 5-phosphatase K-like n=1 Tax=Gigantopelta aegis TaxID=1735272 RepID=UPI001B88D8DA|nr:inositol polyphosphate 5-phosphatase K-like [Gigantopelta aegis]
MSKTSQSKCIRLFLCSWNVGSSKPVSSFVDALNLDSNDLPELYALGLQEVDAYDLRVDEHAWSKALLKDLGAKGYVRIKVRRLQGLMTFVFVKRSILPFVSSIESEATRTGFGGLWGNKGGVSIRLDVFDVNLIIVNSHLAAHQNNVAERMTDFDSILDDQRFRDEDVENILDHDYVFWMGDLNFRLDDLSRDEILKHVSEKQFDKLLENDQLIKCCKQKLMFEDFHEGEITFPPTYKFDVGTDDYDTSPKQRLPAWCDRILWHVYDSSYDTVHLAVKPLGYTSHSAYQISDHKPVTATFEINVFSTPVESHIVFHSPSKISAGVDMVVKYSVNHYSKASTSDWIGLYKSDFSSFRDYITYVWAVDDAEKKVTIKGSYLRVKPGEYYLCYLTRKYSLLGMSEPFRID